MAAANSAAAQENVKNTLKSKCRTFTFEIITERIGMQLQTFKFIAELSPLIKI